MQKVTYKHAKELLYFEGDGALEQVAQRGGGGSLSDDIQDLPVCFPAPPVLAGNLL